MIENIVKGVVDVALDICAVRTIQLNNQEQPRSQTEREQQRSQRKTISNVRNVAWLIKRVIG